MTMENSFSRSSLNAENLTLLIAEIADNYNSVSYHNFTHGFSLTHVTIYYIWRCFINASRLIQSLQPSTQTKNSLIIWLQA